MLCSEITEKHRRLAEITEMIHTASLMHDDVVDESPTRRGAAMCVGRDLQACPMVQCAAAVLSRVYLVAALCLSLGM